MSDKKTWTGKYITRQAARIIELSTRIRELEAQVAVLLPIKATYDKLVRDGTHVVVPHELLDECERVLAAALKHGEFSRYEIDEEIETVLAKLRAS